MKHFKYIIVFIIISNYTFGQELLTRSEAVKLALEFNYDIKVANNNVEIAKNNSSIYNSGYLPRLSGRAGSNISNRNVKRDGEEGIAFSAQGNTLSYNSALEIGYTLFDGMGREYTFKRNKEMAALTELQARQIIERSLLQIFVSYYQVARLTENLINQKQTLEISQDRLLRATYGYEYGQSTQLDVLNAEVDVNTDSIDYLTILQQVDNAKRDLNLLIGRDVNDFFDVDTSVTYINGLTLDAIVADALKKNVAVLQADQMIQNSIYDININRSNLIPSLDLTARYDWSKNNYDANSNFADLSAFGPYAGLNLNWNIFDGGITKTRIQNSRIALDNQKILKDQTEQQLFRNLNNAWTVYETSLFVLEAQRTNLKTNHRNFERTMEQNRLGQVTNIEFRQAQFNQLRAQLSFNQAKYDAKIAELALLQLSGNLLDTEF